MHDDLIRRAEAWQLTHKALDPQPDALVDELIAALKAQQAAPKDCRTCENRYACANPVDREQIGCVNGDKYTGYEPVQLWRRT